MAHPLIVTVDVEDWPQSTFDSSLPITGRAEDNTRRMMASLERHNVRATLFVLAPIAELFPGLVRELHAAGHEIASHGYGHINIARQRPAEFRADVRRAKTVLKNCIGGPIAGYRAPDFSIGPDTLWALQVLAEEGYEYDSSVFPMRTRRYGISGFHRNPVTLELADGARIIELPIGVWQGKRMRLPVGGGGYHRLLPGRVARYFVGRALEAGPFVFYCHPYEIDPGEFASMDVPVPLQTRLHQGLGRSRFDSRLRALVGTFGGTSVRATLARMTPPAANLADYGGPLALDS